MGDGENGSKAKPLQQPGRPANKQKIGKGFTVALKEQADETLIRLGRDNEYGSRPWLIVQLFLLEPSFCRQERKPIVTGEQRSTIEFVLAEPNPVTRQLFGAWTARTFAQFPAQVLSTE